MHTRPQQHTRPGTDRQSRRRFVQLVGGAALTGTVALVEACTAAPAAAPTAVPATTAPAKPTTAPAAPTAAPTVAPAAAPTTTAPLNPTAAPTAAVGSASTLPLPGHFPIPNMPAPDLPASPDGLIPPGYVNFPKDKIFTSVPTPPGDGSTVTIFSWTGNPPVPELAQNTSWQAVNDAVGANLQPNMVPFADYLGTKLATLMASGELPDITVIVTDPTVTLVPEFFEAQCADLTPYLAGDAIKQYPNLAAFPQRTWKSTVYNNKVFGVPGPLTPFVWWFFVHQEALDQAGFSQPKSADDLKQQLVALTKPQTGQYGIVSEGGPQYTYGVGMGLFPSIFGAPNNWAVDPGTGKFTASIETDQYKAAVDYVRGLFAAGVYHPDVAALNTLTADQNFLGRKSIYRYSGVDPIYDAPPPMDPPANIQWVHTFGADGGKGSYFFGRPNGVFAAISKKADPKRVQMLLGILNFLAAPFGSREYVLLRYGVQGVDFTYNDKGNPTLTDKGRAENQFWSGITSAAPVIFDPLSPLGAAYAPTMQDHEKEMAAVGVEDPAIGLFSRTYATKGAQMNSSFGDGVNDIITGRRPMSDFDALVKDWLDKGGTQAKTEFQQAYVATG